MKQLIDSSLLDGGLLGVAPGVGRFSVKGQDLRTFLRDLKAALFMISLAVHLPMDVFFLCLSSAVFMFGIFPSGNPPPPAPPRRIR